ncbi:MAG: iron chelate uptake ABC transporter family permease subunit [Lachnospiraceae bacterium]
MQNFHDFRFHIFDKHRRTHCLRSNRTTLLAGISSLLVCASFFTAILIGKYPISLTALLAGDRMAIRTFWILRLPRALMALFGGFGLGIAGFVYQTIFGNPLASPDIIGVSSGASAGAAFAILFVSSGIVGTTVFAFVGGLLAVCVSLGLSALAPGKSRSSIVLAGIAVHALAQTILMFLKLTADPEKELASIEYWIMGSLGGVTLSKIPFFNRSHLSVLSSDFRASPSSSDALRARGGSTHARDLGRNDADGAFVSSQRLLSPPSSASPV